MVAERAAVTDEEAGLRVELAAAFRLAARFGWHESVANHFSAVVPGSRRRFLMNPRWRHFELVRASELLRLDVDDPEVMTGENPPDVSAWAIHSAIHRDAPHAKVLLHCHPPYATALACLADPTIYPIDQNTARYHGDRVAYDLHFRGMADHAAEGARLARVLGEASVLIMGNHGVAVAGATVAEAFEDLYYLERACQTLMLANASGQTLSVMPPALARDVAHGWEAFHGAGDAHFAQLKEILDRDAPDYRL